MKKLILFCLPLVGLLLTTTVDAQIERPMPSPTAKFEQKVGLTDIVLEFSRPSVKGRELFVDVEKFGRIWRTGANAATTISFSDDVKIEGKEVPAGKYAIYSIPGKTDWTVMLYKDLTLGGRVGDYDESQELARFNVKAKKVQHPQETFFIGIDNIRHDGAVIALQWGSYHVPLTLSVNPDEKVNASIERTLGGPSAGDYYAAASYYHDTGKDLEIALDWINKATNVDEPRYWHLRKKAQILMDLGKKDDAMKALAMSTDAARKAGNNGYADANEKMKMKWMKK